MIFGCFLTIISSIRSRFFKGEVLTLKTYPEKPEGIRQPRKVEFYRGEELVVDSRTLWILMDSQNLKIRRVPEDWLEKI